MKTKSEAVFEQFLGSNNLAFEKIEESSSSRPDYRVFTGSGEIIFEVKELAGDKNFGVVKDPAFPHIKSSSRTIGEHIRRRIEGSKKQIQFGANQGIPSVLLIYNNIDPVFQDFGTEPMDFIAAMYGAYTISIDRESMTAVEWFNGKDRMLQENKNTSFSALGHLTDRDGIPRVILYESIFARVRLPLPQLPTCFEVRNLDVSGNLPTDG